MINRIGVGQTGKRLPVLQPLSPEQATEIKNAIKNIPPIQTWTVSELATRKINVLKAMEVIGNIIRK